MARMGRDVARVRQQEASATARVQAQEDRMVAMAAPQTVMEDVASSIVPTRNPAALWAYYLGLFSLAPFIGPILSVIAFTQARKALGFAAQYPMVKGRVHAVVGIGCGICGGLISATITYLVIFGIPG